MQEAERTVQDQSVHGRATKPRIAGISTETLKSKRDWTLELLEEASATQPHLIELDKSYVLFWYNLDDDRGFRITQRAHDLLSSRGYDSWTYQIQKEMVNTGKVLLLLDEKLNTPWHLQRNKLTVFDPNMAFAMNLTQQDLVQAINLIY